MIDALELIFNITEIEDCWFADRPAPSPSRTNKRPIVKGDKTTTAGRFVCWLTNGPPPHISFHAAHTCHNDQCINPDHLYWEEPGINSSQAMGVEAAARHKAMSDIGRTKSARDSGKTAETLNISKRGDSWHCRLVHQGRVYTKSGDFAVVQKWRDDRFEEFGKPSAVSLFNALAEYEAALTR